MTDRHDLTVPQADALWDAIAIPGPRQATFVEQHERTCKTVARLLTERPFQEVQGRCPACRGSSLFLGSGGHVTCARLDCPNPSAADDLLHGEQPAPAIDRVRVLHRDWEADPGHCAHCQDGMGTPLPWPCPTIRALDAEQPAPAPAATQATDGCTPACDDVPGIRGLLEHVGIDTVGRDITVAGRVVDAAPREHCGDLMPAWVAGPRTECVLPPGHAGSHADDRGARWWYDPHGTGHS